MVSKRTMLTKLLLVFVSVNTMLDYGKSSYSAISDYHQKIKQMAWIKASFISANGVSPMPKSSPTTQGLTNSRVHHAIDYGADPTGKLDSIDALEQAISDAFGSPIEGRKLIQGVHDLGGAQLDLDGGTYMISRPLRLPKTSGGDFMIQGGSLVASPNFPTNRHLIELLPSTSNSYLFEDVTIKDLMIDANFRGGGIAIINSLRTIIDNCYISHFTSNGILIQDGHETFVRNSFIGQHINVGSDHREKEFSGIGINIKGNDNAVTDVVIFSASIGILIQGQANIITGVHCYNKATTWGGTGIYIQAPGFTQTRIVNSYFDFTGIVAEDPVQLHITGSFFLGNAFILLKSLKGVVFGINIVDNMFGGDYTGVPIVQLDQSKCRFSKIEQVIVDRNNARGMVLKSTVAKGSVWRNGTSWTIDFSRSLLFPNLIKQVQYTMQVAGASFPRHILRNASGNRVTVQSDLPTSGTLHVSVDQSNVQYT